MTSASPCTQFELETGDLDPGDLEIASELVGRGIRARAVSPADPRASLDFVAELVDREVAFERVAPREARPERLAERVHGALWALPWKYPQLQRQAAVTVTFDDDAPASAAFARMAEVEEGVLEAARARAPVRVESLATIEPVPGRLGTVTPVNDLAEGDLDHALMHLARSARAEAHRGRFHDRRPKVLVVHVAAPFGVVSESSAALAALYTAVMQQQLARHGRHVSAVLLAGARATRSSWRFVRLVDNPAAEVPLSAREREQLVGPARAW